MQTIQNAVRIITDSHTYSHMTFLFQFRSNVFPNTIEHRYPKTKKYHSYDTRNNLSSIKKISIISENTALERRAKILNNLSSEHKLKKYI